MISEILLETKFVTLMRD